MPSYTREQIARWNSKMGNGYCVDINYLLMHDEKCPHLEIPLDGQPIGSSCKYVDAKFMWMEDSETVVNAYGCKYPKQTGKVYPALHLSLWYKREPDAACSTSSGLGQWIRVGPPQDRRMFSVLQKLTYKYDAETVLALYEGGSDGSSGGNL